MTLYKRSCNLVKEDTDKIEEMFPGLSLDGLIKQLLKGFIAEVDAEGATLPNFTKKAAQEVKALFDISPDNVENDV